MNYYAANISPASVAAASSTTFNVALTNTSSPGSQLSSALIAPPLGFRVTGASLNGAPGHAYVIFNTVVLDRLSLASGSTVHVSVTATAPSKCNSPYTRWFTSAGDGEVWSEDLRLDAANSSVTTTVPCVTATAVKFVNQPADTLVATAITNSPYNTSGSPVTVELVDSGGNLANISGTPVTIALGNKRAASVGGTLTQNTVNGVATFNDLKVDLPNTAYTLTASSIPGCRAWTRQPSTTSTGETDCNSTQDCMLTLTGSASTLAIDAGPNGGQLSGQVDPGTPMDGTGSNSDADPGCAGYTPQNPDWYGFDVTNLGDSGPPAKTLTWTVKNATTDGFQVCFGSTSEFLALNSDGRPSPAQPGTLPDGTQPNADGQGAFVGFLPFCDQIDSDVAEPCIESITPFTDDTSGLTVTVSIPAGFAGDPWMGRG